MKTSRPESGSRKPAPNFDRVARVYRWAEYLALGPLLEQTRNHFLPNVAQCHSAFVLGDGDGRFLARLMQQSSTLDAFAVDSSAAMLKRQRERCRPFGLRLRAIEGSALRVSAPQYTDLVVTHFFLDCFSQEEVDDLATSIAARVQPGTLWLVSDFQVPRNPHVRPFAWVYIRLLYLAFRVLTGLRVTRLPNPQAALNKANFQCLARKEKLFGVLYTELWRLKAEQPSTSPELSYASAKISEP